MSKAERELLWLRRVRDVAQGLVNQTDLEALLPQILDGAIEITEGERGFLVRLKDGKANVETARGFNKTQLRGRAGDVSRTVVERVVETGVGLVTTREEDADVLNVSSVQARRVLSILCVPMRLRGAVEGVLYLDHRFVEGAFSEDDLPVLATFADQAALAIETAELRADAAKHNAALKELKRLREHPAEPVSDAPPTYPLKFGALIGASPAMCRLYERIERAARTYDPVLITGESGCGKLSVAREIHARSELPHQPFLIQGCAAVSDDQLDAELFGGARSKGVLAQAGQGTVVLMEVADLPAVLQGKLVAELRNRSLPCRIVATSTRDLRTMVDAGAFREDLFYRLDVQRTEVPALRSRLEDLPVLLDHFAEEATGRRLIYTDHARKLLGNYAWPGNVLELKNELQRLLGVEASPISARHLSEEIREGRGVAKAEGTMSGKTLSEVEQQMVEIALRDAGGNKARAARALGIPRSSLYGLIERYGITD